MDVGDGSMALKRNNVKKEKNQIIMFWDEKQEKHQIITVSEWEREEIDLRCRRGTRKSIDVGDGSMMMKRNQEKHQIITVWEEKQENHNYRMNK